MTPGAAPRSLIRLPEDLLRRMSELVARDDGDEMAIPSYLHPNRALRWMAWRRLEIMARELHRIRDAQAPDRAATILDFGCGTGALLPTASTRAARVLGVDVVLAPAKLAIAELALERVQLLTPDAANTAIQDASVDLVIAGEVLEHIEPLAPTLAFFDRILAPGGSLLVSLPTESRLYRLGRRMAGFSGHYHHSNAATIHRQILAAGYVPRRRSRLPAPGPFAIYWIIEYRRRDDASLDSLP